MKAKPQTVKKARQIRTKRPARWKAAPQKNREFRPKKSTKKDDGKSVTIGPGRPPILQNDEATHARIKSIAMLQATQEEAAAFLGVSLSTFKRFMDENEEARDAWDMGGPLGRVSLRRFQWQMAKTSVPMAIFLGKNLLGQADKIEQKDRSKDENEDSDVMAQTLLQRMGLDPLWRPEIPPKEIDATATEVHTIEPPARNRR